MLYDCAANYSRVPLSACELLSDKEPDLLNDAILGAIYYHFLMRYASGRFRPFRRLVAKSKHELGRWH